MKTFDNEYQNRVGKYILLWKTDHKLFHLVWFYNDITYFYATRSKYM